MALSQMRQKQSSKAFDLVLQEERVRSVETGREEESAQVVVSQAQERFGNMRLAGALELGPAVSGGGVDSAFLAGDAGFLYDQLSLALAGFDTGLLGPGASNSAVQSAMADSANAEAASLRAASRDGEAMDYDPYHPAVRNMHNRSGAVLPSTVAARIGAAFGHDFSHVRVHTDAGAAAAAEALNARAFAIGSEIWFGRGAFNPGSPEGDRILAHELTHVVQHDEGRLPSATGEGLSVSSPTDSAEREAYANEQNIVSQLAGPSTALPGESIVDAAFSTNSLDSAAGLESAPSEASSADSGDIAHRDFLGKRIGKIRPESSLRPGGGIPVPIVKGHLDLGVASVDAKVDVGLPGGTGAEFSPKQLLNVAAAGVAGHKPADMDVTDRNGNRPESLLSGGGVNVNIRNSGVSVDAKIGGGNSALSVNANLGAGGNSLAVNGNLGAGGNSLAVNANLGAGGNSLSANGNLNAGGVQVSANAAVNAQGAQANVAAALGATGVNAAANLGPDGVKATLDAKTGEGQKEADGEKTGDGTGENVAGGPVDALLGMAADAVGGELGVGGDLLAVGKAAVGGDAGPALAAAGGLLGAGMGEAGPALRALGNLNLPKFDLKKEQIAKLKKNTGKTPEQHQAAIKEHTERIRGQVDQMRDGLRSYAESHAMGIDSEITAQVDALTGDVGSAKARVATAYETARGSLATAAAEGLGTIATAAGAARETLAASLPAQQQRLATMVTEGKARVTALGPSWKENFKKALDEGAKKFEKVAEDCAGELAAAKAGIVNTWPDEGDALQRAENEARRKAASKGVDDAIADFRTGGGQKAAQVRGQEATYNTQIDTAIAAVQTAFDTMQRDGNAQLQAANDRAVTQIASQSAEAETTVTGAQATAHTALSTAETTAQTELDNAQTTNAQSIAAAGEQARQAITGSDLNLREKYAQWFDGVLGGLPKDQATTYDSVREYLEGKERELPGFNSGVMEQLGVGCDNAIKMVTDAGNAAKSAVSRLADSSVAQAASQASAQADGIRATAAQFATGISQTGTAVETAFTQHIGPMGASVEQRITGTIEQLTGALEQAKTSFVTQAAAYGTQLRQRIVQMPQTLRPMADAAGAGVYRNLSGRAQQVHRACKGMGTDENAVYNALRGLTALSGAALESVVWPRLFSAEGDLRSFLIDDLSDDEQHIAWAYLGGNTSLGARLELDACIHWYGDDEAQIEKILRELSPEDLAAMKNDPAWSATRQRLMDNLGGTDLDVTQALLVGNAARADAYRLRDKVNEARRDGDPDALHAALQGVDPATLAAVQQEFHNISNGVRPDATNVPQIDQRVAAQELGDYVTRDIQRVDPNSGEMVTDSVTGANRDLARALAMQGRDSTDAAVSRFEVERGRSGGPNMENMEKALMAPPDLQERLHSPDEQTRLRARAEQDQREQTIRNRYTEQYGGAEQRSMNQAIDGMLSGRSDHEAETSRRLMHNMLSDGTNSPRVAADMIALAADGAGTDEAQIKRALSGLRPDEVPEVDAAYRQQHGESLYSRLGVAERDANGNKVPGRDHSEQWFNELSGDDRREVEELLMGDSRYMNGQQQMALARMQYDWQRGSESGAMGRAMMDGSAEQRDLDRNFSNLNELAVRRRPDGTFTNPEDQREFDRLCGDVGINAAQYQAANDRTANYITTGVAIVGAVVVTAATFGSGAPAGAAMIIAATGTAASGAISMGVNAGMKGGRYGWEQAATDAGIAAVQTVTAGAGAYLNAMNAGTGVFRATTPLQKALAEGTVGAGTGFVNGAAQTAMTDGTWDRGAGRGLLTTLEGGGKQALSDALSSGVSAGMEESNLARSLENSGLAGSTLLKGTTNAAGAVLGTSATVGWDAARGRFNGDLADAAGQVGTEAGKQFVIGAAGGVAGRASKPFFDRRGGHPTHVTDAPGPGNDNHPPGTGARPSGPDNTPPGGGDTSHSVIRPDTTQNQQRSVGSNEAGRTDAPPSAPRGNANLDPNTGRPPAGTSTDASTANVRPDGTGQRGNGGTNDSDAQVVRTPDGTTVLSNQRVVKATDDGVVSINRDGTTDVVDAAGNRTHIDAGGNQHTITPDGTVVVRDADGTAVAVRGDQHTEIDAHGRPISDTSTPRGQDSANREQAVFDRLDQLVQGGKLTHDEAWRILTNPGGVEAQEGALRASEARIGRDDAVMNRLLDLSTMVGPDGKRVVSPAEIDSVIDAPDMQKALQRLDARVTNQRNDANTTDRLRQSTKTDESGVSFVDDVFDNVTIGAGFAGISNESTAMRNGADPAQRLVIGGENPWMQAGSRLGQGAGESAVAGAPHSQASTADSADARFMAAREHAENVEINRAALGVGVLREKVERVEIRSQAPEGTTWHRADADARVLVSSTDADGNTSQRWVYTKHADIASGPGPSNGLRVRENDNGPGQVSRADLDRMVAEGRVITSDQAFDGSQIRPGEKVAVLGAGPSGAWGAEAAYRNADSIEWLGRMAAVSHDMPASQKARLEASLQRYHDAKESGDLVAREAAMREIEHFTFTEAKGNGFLDRNREPGGAFDPSMQSDAGGKITRRVAEDIRSVTYEMNPETGRMMVKVTGADKDGGNPQVTWADRLVLAIGQNGMLPGGPGHLLAAVGGHLTPIIDPSMSRYPFPVVVGAQTPGGEIRVLGSAAATDAVRDRLPAGQRSFVTENLGMQANHSSVPSDSAGVVGGFNHAMRMIEAANGSEVLTLASMTPEQQRTMFTQHQADWADYRARESERRAVAPELPSAPGRQTRGTTNDGGTGTGPTHAEGVAPSGSDSGRASGTLDSARPTDVLHMHSSEFSQDVQAQRTLFEAAGAAVARMKAAAGEISADLPNVEVSSLRKRDDFEGFVTEVMKKQTAKGYGEVGEMSDIVRGRFNVESADDMAVVAQRLQERFGADVVEVKPPRDGYPRWHVNVRDAETGLVHEWQIGTKATTDFFERKSLTIPDSITQFTGRPDFHDGVYKLLNKVNDPELRARYGIDEMMVGYKQLTEETGAVRRGQTEPDNYRQRYDELSRSISEKLARIEQDQPGYFDRLLGGGETAKSGSAPDAGRTTPAVDSVKPVSGADTQRPPGSLDSSRATDVLDMHHTAFAQDPTAQHTLFDAAGAAVGRMKQAGTEIAGDMPGTEVSSLRKRDDFETFVSEVLKKQTTKNYPNIGEMSDIVRGRFNCASGEDMAIIAQRLQERFGAEVVEVKPPRDGYPRWHVNIRDAETGLVHEWQIGTKSTTDFFETRSLSIPSSITEFTGRNDFHDGVYKLLNKVKDPALRAQYGIDEMMASYKQLTEETGTVTREKPLPANYKERYDKLAADISGKIAAIEQNQPGFFNALLKGGGGGH